MGSNPKQALGLVLFLAGWTVFATGCYMDSVIVNVLGLAVVAAALFVFLKAKPLEHIEN
ncbi:MAG: hypothetical protein ABI806_20950 [Candidatus Solibacter sp.]